MRQAICGGGAARPGHCLVRAGRTLAGGSVWMPTRTPTHTHTHPHMPARAHTHARRPTRTHAHAHTHPHMPTRAHTHPRAPRPTALCVRWCCAKTVFSGRVWAELSHGPAVPRRGVCHTRRAAVLACRGRITAPWFHVPHTLVLGTLPLRLRTPGAGRCEMEAGLSSGARHARPWSRRGAEVRRAALVRAAAACPLLPAPQHLGRLPAEAWLPQNLARPRSRPSRRLRLTKWAWSAGTG